MNLPVRSSAVLENIMKYVSKSITASSEHFYINRYLSEGFVERIQTHSMEGPKPFLCCYEILIY